MADEHTPLITIVRVAPQRERYPHSTLRRFCSIALGCSLIVVVAVFVLSFFFFPEPRHGHHGHISPWPYHPPGSSQRTTGLSREDLWTVLLDTPSEDRAREWSKYYTEGPHLAGQNFSQALWTKDRWEEFGVKSEILAYDIYLNYPVDHRLALLKLGRSEEAQDTDFTVEYECVLKEDVLEEDPTSGMAIPTFHGYSASGNVTAPFVYVNFGTYQDYDDLLQANVSLEGKIALAKYGRNFRGLKTMRAQELGMVGIAIYSDPQEDGDITELNGYAAYPDGPARNPSSVQRGSTSFISILPGDPTTPEYPSLPGVNRTDPHASTPTIPSLPISYVDALPLLKALNGYGPKASDFNKYWQGGGLAHKGVEYSVGPTPEDVVLNLWNEQEYVTTPLWDVIGIINGTIPDEAIIIGNHRDAWTPGAGDPNAGSAALNEAVRSFGEAVKAGYKPLRTIVFASWDGEEYSLIGSTEWVEDKLPWLKKDGLAYINLDDLSGSNFGAAASPLLIKALHTVTKSLLSPNQTVEGQTIYDIWGGSVGTMGSGSDFTAFQDFAGIPSLTFTFGRSSDEAVYHYHSLYDSFFYMEKFGDPGFYYHVAAAKIINLLTATLAEEPLIYFNATDYAIGLKEYLGRAKKTAQSTSASFSFKPLEEVLDQIEELAVHFDEYAASLADRLDESLPWWKWWKKVRLFYDIRKTNEKYKYLERQMLYQGGLDGRSYFKHVVFAPDRRSGYSGATFPGLIESFEDGNSTNAERWGGIILERLQDVVNLLG